MRSTIALSASSKPRCTCTNETFGREGTATGRFATSVTGRAVRRRARNSMPFTTPGQASASTHMRVPVIGRAYLCLQFRARAANPPGLSRSFHRQRLPSSRNDMRKPIAASLAVIFAAACTLEAPQVPDTPAAASPARVEAPAQGGIASREERARAVLSSEGAGRPPAVRPSPRPLPMPVPPADRERYPSFDSAPVRLVAEAPVPTFSGVADTGRSSNVRRMLVAGRLPPKDAVRVEEMINYFPYDYPGPDDEHPFAVHAELVDSPWRPGSWLLRIGIKGADRARESLPPANLVFLVDVSGSMRSADKLPLLKSSLKLLAQRLRAEDRISLVTYASGTRLVLDATPGSEKAKIVDAIESLQAGGGTAGASGLELAYRTARQAFVPDGINRILLTTDGDFNVGVTDFGQLESMVQERRRSGIALSTLGFGTGNYNEHLMERLADAGDGAYSYID